MILAHRRTMREVEAVQAQAAAQPAAEAPKAPVVEPPKAAPRKA